MNQWEKERGAVAEELLNGSTGVEWCSLFTCALASTVLHSPLELIEWYRCIKLQNSPLYVTHCFAWTLTYDNDHESSPPWTISLCTPSSLSWISIGIGVIQVSGFPKWVEKKLKPECFLCVSHMNQRVSDWNIHGLMVDGAVWLWVDRWRVRNGASSSPFFIKSASTRGD